MKDPEREAGSFKVKTFVGIDVHPEHCTVKGLTRQAETVLEVDVPTRVKDLRGAVAGLAKPVWVMFEAGAMSPFVKWSLEGYVERVIVCETRENRWISQNEHKGDPEDANRLARLLRMGEYKEVHVPDREHQEIRELVRLYGKTVKDVVRIKNRIKGKLHEHGVCAKGETVYDTEGREKWLKPIHQPAVRWILGQMYQQMDELEALRDQAANRLHRVMRRHRAYELMMGIPGVGPVIASVLIAVIADPNRFGNKRKLWKYAALGVCRRWSGDPSKGHDRGTKSGNRLLKYMALTAAGNAIRGENRLARHYERMVAEGIESSMAIRTTARNILATALAMWKSETAYRDAI